MNRFTVALIIVADATLAFIDPASGGERHVAVIDLTKPTVARTIGTGNEPDGMAWVP